VSAARLKAIVLDDYLECAARLGPWSRLEGRVDIEFATARIVSRDALRERLRDRHIVCLMRERTPFGRGALRAAPDLQLLVTSGMSNTAIDLDAATRAGVVVSGTSSAPDGPVELTWGLILAAARSIVREDTAIRNGRWQTELGIGLRGRRLGVLGLGRIGSAVARIGLAFGMEVVAWSDRLTRERAAAVGATLVTKDELLQTSDVVTIHLRLSDRTRGLIGIAEMERMRPATILVNTSRGPIVDEGALIAALEQHRIRGAALDVYWDEPLPASHPLLAMGNVVLSPHQGYVTEENLTLFYTEMVEDIDAFIRGAPVRVLNAEVRPAPT
jgi:phosphoglycerate dehydrogenase-like enzyme